jgi:DNA-binding response OmpR family regulator
MTKTIMLVDDEIQLLSLLSDVLQKEGYKILTARNGEEALFQARHGKPDLIILDVMMSKMDGYEFMRQHRRESNTPIIMLTAKVDEGDKVLGLQLGADDYVTKPFSPKELVARVQALFRRTGPQASQGDTLRVGAVTLDNQTHLVSVNDKPVELTRSEFDLLAILMAAPGRVFSRAKLLEKLQETVVEGYERTVDVHINNLRSKIEPDPSNPRYIETVYGVGYRFSSLSLPLED